MIAHSTKEKIWTALGKDQLFTKTIEDLPIIKQKELAQKK